MTAIPVLLAFLSPYLSHRQHTGNHNVTLREMLARRLSFPVPRWFFTTHLNLIVPGSGPTDRDGNNPLSVNASPYRLLAEGLAAKGFATLRIDKRGMFASAMAVEDANAVTIADYVDDVRSWIKVLKSQMHTHCIWILGHSEGGVVALASAQEEDVCGVVLIATPGRPMGEVLRGQLKANPENEMLLKQALPVIDALEDRRRVDITNMHPALQKLFNPAVQGFLINAFSYNPVHLISTILNLC